MCPLWPLCSVTPSLWSCPLLKQSLILSSLLDHYHQHAKTSFYLKHTCAFTYINMTSYLFQLLTYFSILFMENNITCSMLCLLSHTNCINHYNRDPNLTALWSYSSKSPATSMLLNPKDHILYLVLIYSDSYK